MPKRSMLISYFVFMGLILVWGMPVQAKQGAPPLNAPFVDPTATVTGADKVHLGDSVYVAPFAELRAGADPALTIHIGAESDVQDSAVVDATAGAVSMGEQVILAHGATVKGPASLGGEGICPGSVAVCPSFVSFNAEVDGAIIEKDAMVSGLARVAPGVRIPSGRKVLPGKNVATQAEVLTETVPVSDADRLFMQGVIEVNVAFAAQYKVLAAEDPKNIKGINYDPGNMSFNPARNLPTLAGTSTQNPKFRNRIIGDIIMHDNMNHLAMVMGSKISLRADEGEPFHVGSIAAMEDRTTFHALEHSHLDMGNLGRYGYHSVVHGGPTNFPVPAGNSTVTGDGVTIGAWSVFFRSRAADGVTIGFKSLVQQSDLAPGTIVPDRTVMIDNTIFGAVEW
ncbi:acetyltransferase [Candidatus Manganitrophus noduliformans]|uniref:Acetyltransferase n=1 Tax=Candidatus Manganitrophus noduliformans TaxID=2606439 RepID=A0A7X6DUR8_9BACT|nr:acetyltransferase [Candidatus Manganitrophus noduliformans]NKE73772.1 acetyltransferase [Candidatus Manganitrophus noduliformans]